MQILKLDYINNYAVITRKDEAGNYTHVVKRYNNVAKFFRNTIKEYHCDDTAFKLFRLKKQEDKEDKPEIYVCVDYDSICEFTIPEDDVIKRVCADNIVGEKNVYYMGGTYESIKTFPKSKPKGRRAKYFTKLSPHRFSYHMSSYRSFVGHITNQKKNPYKPLPHFEVIYPTS